MIADELSIPQRLWFGYEPWVLVSSLVFAAAPLNNLWPTNEDNMRSSFIGYFGPEMLKSEPRLSWMNVFGPLRQAAGAGFFSLRVFSPLYQQRGLPASIAAHFAWNLGVLVSFQQLGAVKSVCNCARPRHEKSSQRSNTNISGSV
jgi:membrane protease YdiL (CAAX protease family)